MIKKIELLANVAIIAVAVLLGITLVKDHLVARPVQPGADNVRRSNERTQIGDKVNLPGIDWQKNGRTLILAVSSSCHFCTDSAPFYRRLVEERAATRLVAVLPQPSDEGKDYLSKHGVAVDEVRQASLDSIGVTGTPTLIMADSEGRVSGIWFGRLPPEKESEVLNQVH
jgi:thioredoxin-related protein